MTPPEPVVEHAGTGLRVSESLARTLDELSKGLPAECAYRRAAKHAVIDELDPGSRTDVSFITTDDVDRDEEVVLPQGGETKDFSGVVTFAHQYDQLPVGKNLWIRPKVKGKANGLIAKTYYHTKPADWGDAPWLPSAILHLMQSAQPVCGDKSIGFLPMEIREATAEEKTMRPEWKGKRIISRWKLLEYAVAPVPANPQANLIAVSKALKAGGLLDEKIAMLLGIKDMDDAENELAMPVCPKCKSAEHVRKKDDDMYSCSMCGLDFKPADNDGDADDKAKGAVSVNEACASRARSMIRSGKCEHDGKAAPKESERKQEQCLGSGLSYPIIDGDHVNLNWLHAAEAYSARYAPAVHKVAAELAKLAKEREAKLAAALAAPFYTEDAYRAAKLAQYQKSIEQVHEMTQRLIEAAVWRASGRV